MDSPLPTAAYARLSREDGDRPDSDSILNQLTVLEQFCARQPELELAFRYTDDGYTGTNFRRPAFQRMLEDIRAGRVGCVVVKNLSRFGRDYIDAGYYLERWFPAHGVRFIAVEDHVDSGRGDYDLLLPIRNFFNAQYPRDVSRQVRTTFRGKMEQGSFIGAFPCYGYRKDPDRHGHLLPDPPAAGVVREIYRRFAAGMSKQAVARMLEQRGVPSPAEYKRLTGSRFRCPAASGSAPCRWQARTIDYILKNPVYAGDMAQGRFVRSVMHGPCRSVPREDWVTVRDTHPALIPRDQWEGVQRLLERRGRTRKADAARIGLWSGVLRCGDCGSPMVRRTLRGEEQYVCGSYRRHGTRACTAHTVPSRVLEQIVLNDLNQLLDRFGGKAVPSASVPPPVPAEDTLSRALEQVRRRLRRAYEDYQDGLLGREEYLSCRRDYQQREQALARQRDALPLEPPSPPPPEGGPLTALTRACLAQAVAQIRVFNGDRLEIDYLWQAEQPPG